MSSKRIHGDDVRRFWSHVNKDGDCWEWTGALSSGGYGTIQIGGVNGRKVRTHRYSWSMINGHIPDGMFICHRCDNRKCVRVDHLFLGSRQDNIDDAVAKGRASGPRGESSYTSKLSRDDIPVIRTVYDSGEMNTVELAYFFGVTSQSIGDVVRRKSWKHIP